MQAREAGGQRPRRASALADRDYLRGYRQGALAARETLAGAGAHGS
jgi:hypothetical protein